MAKAKTTTTKTTTKAKGKAAGIPVALEQAEPQEIRNLSPDVQEKIRERAYELWERRGRDHGNAQDDWLEAEREILGRIA